MSVTLGPFTYSGARWPADTQAGYTSAYDVGVYLPDATEADRILSCARHTLRCEAWPLEWRGVCERKRDSLKADVIGGPTGIQAELTGSFEHAQLKILMAACLS